MNKLNSKHKILLLLIAGIFFTNNFHAQVSLSMSPSQDGKEFPLVNQSDNAGIYYDLADEIALNTYAKLFTEDIFKVTGEKIPVRTTSEELQKNIVVVGTIGKNRLIDQLINDKKLNVTSIEGEWERYQIQLVDNPFPNVEKALVIVGSDRRGAAYGLFSISEEIGVSPWNWWADVPVKKKKDLFLKVNEFTSSTPTVKYRGVFINDEDWGLLRWARDTFDPELNDIGPKTYRKVFELLLRLKANYLAPAMHEASGAFNKYPENKMVADTFGIVMGSVHPEPLLFNNASEWDTETMGPWNYLTNRENILKVLDKRVQENSPFENVYTVGLRGLHDKAMEGGYPIEKRVELIENANEDQRNILKKHIDKPIEKIPQAFTPYKEVLDIYSAGMDLPEDITIVWPDDNYGYMKRLSNEQEQKRSGGSGVYYHASYLGSPHDYLWLSSTPPNLMYEELKKAYDTGADRLWLLNAGDIKSAEFPVALFLEMAYDITQFNFDNVPLFQAKWLSSIYGEEYYEEIEDVTTSYNHLAFSRKPEFMGWGYEWNTYSQGRERTTDTDFSFSNYNEAENRIVEYERIASISEQIMSQLPEDEKPSFYQLLYYPVKGAELMNKMRLTAQKNRWYAFQNRSKTNELRRQTEKYYDSLQIITEKYNSLLNGKWNRVMSMVQGVTASYFEMPKLDSISLPEDSELNLFVQNSEPGKGVKNFHALPAFNPYLKKEYFIDVFNSGEKELNWKVMKSADWIKLNKYSGTTKFEDRLWVSVDWDIVPIGEGISGELIFTSNGKNEKVIVSVFNPQSPSLSELNGLFVENNGYISIPGADFHRKNETEDIKIQVIDNLGYEDKSVVLGDPTAPMQNPKSSTAPSIEYDFYSFNYGRVDVYTYVLPVFPLTSNRDFGFHESSNEQTKYAVFIDSCSIATPSSSAPEYSHTWSENVIRNAAINKSTLYIDKQGKHTLKIRAGDPGMVIQKIVIDFGGMKKSYLGPPSTKVEVEDKGSILTTSN